MNIKINKSCRFLFILLSCLLLFGFLFAPFQRVNGYADELYPGLPKDNIASLLDFDRLSIYDGSTTDVDYPKPLYPDKIVSLYESGYTRYFNKTVLGVTYLSEDLQVGKPVNIYFSTASDNATSIGELKLARYDWQSEYSTYLYKSNSYIDLSSFTSTSQIVLNFADSLIPLGTINDTSVSNAWLLNNRGFNLYFIGSNPYNLNITVSYKCLYNMTSPPDGGGGSVEPVSEFLLSETFSSVYTFGSNENGIAGGLVYTPSFNNFSPGSQYYIKGNFDFCYRFLTDFTITVDILPASELSAEVRQVSFTNYSYLIPDGLDFSIFDVISTNGLDDNFYSFDVGTFLGNAVGGFFSLELLPGVSLLSIFAVIIAIPLTITFLKFFAGG